MERTLIIGYGNTLRGDDGFGPVVVQHFADENPLDSVDTLICQQLTLDLAERFQLYQRIIFVDASASGGQGVRLLPLKYRQQSSQQPPFSHSVSIKEILWATSTLYDSQPDAFLLTVTGRSFEYCESLSHDIQQQIPEAVAQLSALALSNQA